MKPHLMVATVIALSLISCSGDLPTSTKTPERSNSLGIQNNLAKRPDTYLKISRTAQEPIIDGRQDDLWSNFPNNKLSLYVNEPNPIDGPNDLSGSFKIIWDDNYLYIIYSVKDEEINTSNELPWFDDCMEIFLDGDNSKNDMATGYDSYDDQLRFVFGENPTSQYNNVNVSAFNVVYLKNKKGYTIEAALPFSSLTFPPCSGHILGFETHVADNDLGFRQNFVRWYSIINCYDTWRDASVMGTAILVE